MYISELLQFILEQINYRLKYDASHSLSLLCLHMSSLAQHISTSKVDGSGFVDWSSETIARFLELKFDG